MSSWFPTDDKPFLGNFVESQANLLAEEYRVSFVRLLSQRQNISKKTESPSFQYIDVFYKKSRNPLITYFTRKKALKKAFSLIGTVDLMHVHVSFPDGWLFRYAKKLLKKPMVITEHGSYFSPEKQWSFRMRNDIPLTLKKADIVIAVSSFLAGDITKRFPFVKVEIVGNPIDLNQFEISNKRTGIIEFLHISTLDKVKNADTILLAFSRVVKKHPFSRLTIVSDENYLSYRKMAEQLRISDSVTFEGPVPHDEIPDFYKKADCLVMNSVYESFSIVIAEAWGSGIPVISTPVGIAVDMSPELGILTDGTQKGIEKAMLSIIDDQHRFDPGIIRKYAENYSVESFREKINSIYNYLFD